MSSFMTSAVLSSYFLQKKASSHRATVFLPVHPIDRWDAFNVRLSFPPLYLARCFMLFDGLPTAREKKLIDLKTNLVPAELRFTPSGMIEGSRLFATGGYFGLPR